MPVFRHPTTILLLLVPVLCATYGWCLRMVPPLPEHRRMESGQNHQEPRADPADRAAAAEARVRPGMEMDLAVRGLFWGDPVFLRAFKEERVLEVWVCGRSDGKFHHFKTYPVAGLSGSLGPKLAEGDRQVPEGFYFSARRHLNPESDYHLSFNIGFPNAYDRHHGRTGSFIMVHGGTASVGCLAMTDPGIEEIYSLCAAALAGGQPFYRIHLFPFRMTGERLARESGQPWAGFWRNLKQGHDWFEEHKVPPEADLREGAYVFGPD